MVLESNVLSVRDVESTDILGTTLGSPSDGELWYVDGVRIACNGDGNGNSFAECNVGVIESQTGVQSVGSNAMDEVVTVKTARENNVASQGTETLGTYVTGVEEVRIRGIEDDGGTFSVFVKYRRLL